MTPLGKIERDLLDLLDTIGLRTTLERAGRIGDLLREAKDQIEGHGWYAWLARVGLNVRTANDYVLVSRGLENQRPAAGIVGVRAFLVAIRKGRKVRPEREDIDAPMTPEAHIHTADCRLFKWPPTCDVIATDPAWAHRDQYIWLASFARKTLRPGGLLLVQCGQAHIADRLALFTATGLTYYWTLAIVFGDCSHEMCSKHFTPNWRPVLVLSQGPATRHKMTTDVVLIRGGTEERGDEKEHHAWQQPIRPWQQWLTALVAPGSLLLDPYAGSGTIALAALQNNLRSISTEIDPQTARTARHRLATHKKGTIPEKGTSPPYIGHEENHPQ